MSDARHDPRRSKRSDATQAEKSSFDGAGHNIRRFRKTTVRGHSPEEFIEAVAPYAPVAIGVSNYFDGAGIALAVPARQPPATAEPFSDDTISQTPDSRTPKANLAALGPDEFAAAPLRPALIWKVFLV